MNTMDLRMGQAYMTLHQQEARQLAESCALRRLGREQARGWWTRQGCWLLCQGGRLLVAWGERLKGYERPQIRPVENGAVGN